MDIYFYIFPFLTHYPEYEFFRELLILSGNFLGSDSLTAAKRVLGIAKKIISV
jgi:hypothetical protein